MLNHVEITLVKGENLVSSAEAREFDPFCILCLGKQRYISTIKHGVNPKWNESFIFDKNELSAPLKIFLMKKNRDEPTENIFIDVAEIDLEQLLTSMPLAETITLKTGTISISLSEPKMNPDHARSSPVAIDASMARQTLDLYRKSDQSNIQTLFMNNEKIGPRRRRNGMKHKMQKSSEANDIRASGQHHFLDYIHRLDRKGEKIGGKVYGNYDNTFSDLNEEETYVPPTSLPEEHEEADEELAEKEKRWARIATFLSKPFDYRSKYIAELQQLDAMGAINLDRIRREQIPPITIKYCAALFFVPREGEVEEISGGLVRDVVALAELFVERGYRVVYFCDATPKEYMKWMDWLMATVEDEIFCYFGGYGAQVDVNAFRNKRMSRKDIREDSRKMTQIMLFSNEEQRKRLRNRQGDGEEDGERMAGEERQSFGVNIQNEALDDQEIYQLIVRKEYPETRLVLFKDIRMNDEIFGPSSFSHSPSASTSSSSSSSSSRFDQHLVLPPPSVVSVSSLHSAFSVSSSESSEDTSISPSSAFVNLLKENPSASFSDLAQNGMRLKTDYEEDIEDESVEDNANTHPSFQIACFDEELSNDQIIVTLVAEETEIQLNEIDEELLGVPPEEITSIPEEDEPSAIEQEMATVRWAQFCAELAKPAPYTSKYKEYLQKLDAMGALNLERITRDQIPPNIYIDHCAALFINPYEDLPHTLDAGPLGDALLLAELFLARGYYVVYFCDATPHEYYRWMDWLLDNVETEFVSFFSGHGTQIPDTTGKEADGLSEVLVFYDSTRKKKAAGADVPKIEPIQGITNETVDDDCMFSLITSKEYPQTRVVLLTDCCHSGTMFNFDQEIPPDAHGLTPPMNVVCVGSAEDSQTAKQTVFKGTESGVFTYNFTQLLKEKPHTTFLELKEHMDKKIKKYQSIQLTGSTSELYSHPIIVDNDDAE
ncbi:putative metacaspase-like cysteine peptidase [Monocercomonoides exilis]|uniref:putative metacaspase-like cysteine peptidase n=1 Tax=Monocercomonoides exilis TaxID=2049356 RepID=UPI00355A3758|nr:putative metacaspase-like cysteine peptidase [Monocercomonoides exilis]|eukprot:MONOS_11445.1-p1 / transcript=MONOS_11445.1 / gene=MONOS_11445 / organism=Monocercomonoides_exilis_PA203 / gene_product=Clan CD, family C14, metacaspase-like cysteine peptidase / transcript_product=Clan CD, family C14, metacaspase-like cysteine peptidase / location=Mono_scaffold00575:5487-8397(+) / protein_length=942 / sequence_SO=supercontig / SO=protein_coding / is_pseudo=false